MSKVKVIEVEALKLDKDAHYLIVFNSTQIPPPRMALIAEELKIMGVKFVGTNAHDPATALKVYQIPKEQPNET